LRTTFPAEAGRPRRTIAETSASSRRRLPVVDLQDLSASTRQRELLRLASAEALRPFDLATGPLVRPSILRLGSASHVVLLTMHHIVCDAWSIGVMMTEVEQAYARAYEGQPTAPADLPIQYADYAAWQRRWLHGDVLARELTYWRREFAEAVTTPLIVGRARTGPPTGVGAHSATSLRRDLANAVLALGRRVGATLHMTLFAAFALLLAQTTRRDDVVIGLPIGSRVRREVEPLVGCFANVLPVRVRVSEATTFGGLLVQVRRVTLDALAHQHVPLEKILDELQGRRRDGLAPYAVTFGAQNVPRGRLATGDLRFSTLPVRRETVRFDLAVKVMERPDEIGMTWIYASDVLDESRVVRLQSRYAALLDDVVAQPQADLDSLSLGRDRAPEAATERLQRARPAAIKVTRA